MDYREFLEIVESRHIEMVDLKVVDLLGRLHHVTLPVESFSEKTLREGVGFDGSSYGFLKVERSDMVLKPDLKTAFVDPFAEIPTISMLCTIHLTDPERTRYPYDPRYIVEKTVELLRSEGLADDIMWGPEYEFYLFDEVEVYAEPESSGYHIICQENIQHNAYHLERPDDRYYDFRNKAVSMLMDVGIKVKYHHHEVGRKGQQEIETQLSPSLRTADSAVIIKYILTNLAYQMGLFITFMPKPFENEAGNGWHLHQYMVKDGKNLFYGQAGYRNLSETALYYIGGLLRHAPALCAITNPSTNSYRRLVPGYEAPVAITFATANRTSAIRIPGYVNDPERTRIEYRPPDFTGNPYLTLAAIALAGIDGILNRIDPKKEGLGPSDEVNGKFESLPTSLPEALKALEEDHNFLLRGGIFTEELIEKWITLKKKEVEFVERKPHPAEFLLYF